MLRGWLLLSLGTIWQGGSCELNYRCCQCSRLSLDQHSDASDFFPCIWKKWYMRAGPLKPLHIYTVEVLSRVGGRDAIVL